VDISPVLQRRLLNGELDLVVRVDSIDHPEIVSTALAVYPVHWIARKGLISPRPAGLAKRVLHHPIMTFARGTQPQRALEEALVDMASREDIPIEQVRVTPSPSVAAIVQLVKDGYGLAAIPSVFVKDFLDLGEFVELPVQPSLPSFVVTMCRHSETELKVHATAATIRKACLKYGHTISKRFVKMVC
jgi:DNA-binding transcriptional LysR family regulator